MSADAALVYLRRYDVLVGERVVVATNNDSAYAAAAALREPAHMWLIVDTRARSAAAAPDGIEVMRARRH